MAEEKDWRARHVDEYREQIIDMLKETDYTFAQINLLYDIVEQIDDWEVFFRLVGKRFH